MTWQPITTASKDGSDILAYEMGVIYQIYWSVSFGRFCNRRTFKYVPNPAHWMPLIEPPKLS